MPIQIIQEQPGFASRFAQGIGRGLGKDTLGNVLTALMGSGQEGKGLSNLLQQAGVNPQQADLVARSPKGAQSAYLKELFKHQEPSYEDEFGGLGKHAEGEPPGSANFLDYLMKEPTDQQELEDEQLFSFQEPEYEEDIAKPEKLTAEQKKGVDKYWDEIRGIEEEMPVLDASLDVLKNTLRSGNISGFAPWFASALHLEPLYNSDLSAFQTAMKNYFLSSVRLVGTRPNQWIEQQIQSAHPRPGRSVQDNLKSLAFLEYETDIKRARAQIARELEKKHGKKDLSGMVNNKLNDYALKRRDILGFELRALTEETMSDMEMKEIKSVPKDTPLTPRMAEILFNKYGSEAKAQKEAKKLGFTILPDEFYEGLE